VLAALMAGCRFRASSVVNVYWLLLIAREANDIVSGIDQALVREPAGERADRPDISVDAIGREGWAGPTYRERAGSSGSLTQTPLTLGRRRRSSTEAASVGRPKDSVVGPRPLAATHGGCQRPSTTIEDER
jgi:hypothetical protein